MSRWRRRLPTNSAGRRRRRVGGGRGAVRDPEKPAQTTVGALLPLHARRPTSLETLYSLSGRFDASSRVDFPATGQSRLRGTVGRWDGTGDCDDGTCANGWWRQARLGGERRQEGAVRHATCKMEGRAWWGRAWAPAVSAGAGAGAGVRSRRWVSYMCGERCEAAERVACRR